MPTCKNCTTEFAVTDADRAFYAKIDVPEPTLCPDCRQQRRLSFRNEITLYPSTCALCSKSIISMYNPAGPYTVYCQECWWGDGWDPTAFGRDYNPNRPFLEQFAELMLVVPRVCLINKEAENSEYCNFSWRNKNSYLLMGCGENEDLLYSHRCWKSRSSADCINLYNCELCYEVTDSVDCYNCAWLEQSIGCADCWLGYNLSGCSNCFGCTNLINQRFHIFNQPVVETEYHQQVATLKRDLPAALQRFQVHKVAAIRRYAEIKKSVNCTGDAIVGSKNCHQCFRIKDAEDCSFACDATVMHDCYDVNNDDHSELLCECIGSETNHNQQYADICWFNRDVQYCSLCMNSKDLFGCVGMKNGSNCILNKKYFEEEYIRLRQQIISTMQQRGEYGEFFSVTCSPYGYNETNAAFAYPLTRDQAIAAGWRWQDALPAAAGQPTLVAPPTELGNIDSVALAREVVACVTCGRNYKFVAPEVVLYKTLGVPLPTSCFRCRYTARLARRNGQKLYTRNCMRLGCGNEFVTPYAPDRPEKVYCEECYQKEIY